MQSLKIDVPRAEHSYDVGKVYSLQVFQAGQFPGGRKWKTSREWFEKSFREILRLFRDLLAPKRGRYLTITRGVDAKKLTNWTGIVLHAQQRKRNVNYLVRKCTWIANDRWLFNTRRYRNVEDQRSLNFLSRKIQEVFGLLLLLHNRREESSRRSS